MAQETQKENAASGAVALLEPKALEIREGSQGIVARARGVAASIVDDATLQSAADAIGEIAQKRKLWGEKMNAIKSPQYKAWQETCKLEKEVDAPYKTAEDIIRAAALEFNNERNRKAEEERIRAEEAARKKDEDDRLRMASVHEEVGDHEAADEILESDSPVLPQPPPPPPPAKISGLAFTETWKADVYDLKALCRAVADGVVPETMVVPAWTELNAVAKGLKAELKWPGVRGKKEVSTARR